MATTEKAPQKGGAPGSAADPFATAKSNLRDTIKWLATTFAALVAVIMAGSSLTGISQIHGLALFMALLGGLAGLICVILATGVMLRLLTSESFYVGELLEPANAPLLDSLNRHSTDILPPGYDDIAAFLRLRREALEQAKLHLRVPGSLAYEQAAGFLEALTEPLGRLANLAQFEKMRKAFDESMPTLWWLALGAILGLGVFAVFAVAPQTAKPSNAVGAQAVSDALPPATHAGAPAMPVSIQDRETLAALARSLNTSPEIHIDPDGTAKIHLSALLDLVQSLGKAGLLTAGTAASLADELTRAAVDGGKEIVVETAKALLHRWLGGETETAGRSGLATYNINWSARPTCCPSPPKELAPPKRHQPAAKPRVVCPAVADKPQAP
jgi:hypothetical protein